MPDKTVREAQSWVTTPFDIALSISKSLAEKVIVAKVDEDLWDLGRPLEKDCSLELLDFEEPEAKKVFWHSSSHVLGYAMERYLNCKLSIGPPLEGGGFFYEADTDGRAVAEDDYSSLEAACKELTGQKAPFQRLVVAKDDAVEMFSYNPYKATILKDKVPEGGFCTVYKCGDLIDPCRGPHIFNTNRVKALAVTKNSAAYFQGKAENASLQRVYGIAFPNNDLMKQWKQFMEQAAQNDHRNVGKQQSLWMFHEFAPGCSFFYPHGARIYNTLISFIKTQYRKRGFDEVMTPNVYHHKLWEQSGHWQHYSENMFKIEIEKEIHSLKPMNCPGHMLMFASKNHSYRDLPMRFADFGVLHRNELSGSLQGLTRVRRFQQDDAHIFMRTDQIESEVESALEFVQYVYDIFGFQFYLNLSTRNPEKYLGDLSVWDDAESRLRKAMCKFCNIPLDFVDFEDKTVPYDGSPGCIKTFKKLVELGKYEKPLQYWVLNPHDAAFYGPKIDIQVEDCMKRKHQCATIQLDFILPERFKLSYIMSPQEREAREAAGQGGGVDGVAANTRPVVVHRAILGSVERSLAVLTEHWAGKWPFWISPRQVIVVPVAHEHDEYANSVRQKFHDAGFYTDADLGDNSLPKKVRNAQLAQYNFILVTGSAERENGTVAIRTRDGGQHGEKKVEEVLSWLEELRSTHSKEH
uniref:threonine--tRNA ligase n=1 Tax=Eutreptiella gymnastica TaxID=73025 RepID=A0A7S1INF0_9EUGL